MISKRNHGWILDIFIKLLLNKIINLENYGENCVADREWTALCTHKTDL